VDTVLLIFISSLYILGVFFFFVKKDYLGSSSVPLRVLCFVFSPVMVIGLMYEIFEDWLKGNRNTRTQ